MDEYQHEFSETGKTKIYQPHVNPHIFSAHAHTDSFSAPSDVKIWTGHSELN